MASSQWADSDEAQKALRTIVSNPAYGVDALSSSQTMANLLKDLLPDAPREVSILVAAAEAGVASNLRDHVSQGMDVGTASAVVAGAFAARTPFRPEACTWAVNEIAGALGLNPGGTGAPQETSPPSGAPPTISSTPGAGPGGSQQGGFQQPGYQQPGSQQGGFQQPGYQQPGYQQPGYQQPGYQQPGYQQPGYQQPGYQQGAYQPGSYQQPGYPAPGQVSPSGYPSAPPRLDNAPRGYQSPTPPGYLSQQQPGYVPRTKTNGLAVASLVLGILWLFWVGSVAGLILGIVGLKQTKARNERGRGLAIAGIVLSSIWLVILIFAIIGASAKGS